MSRPSVAELRPVVHPPGVKDRRSGEHWMGRLYMREVSLRVDRYLVNTRVTPNQLTYLMTVFGVLAAPALLVPGIAGAVLGVVMVQLYLLLDCVDGEGARWKKQYSLGGVYLDRVGAYLCDAAVLVGLRLRAADLGAPGASTGCGPFWAPWPPSARSWSRPRPTWSASPATRPDCRRSRSPRPSPA